MSKSRLRKLHVHFNLQCVKLIYGYMGFATFMIFFFMTGSILVDVLQTVNIHIDAISLILLLYNFSIVGSTILFFTPAPLLLKQVCLHCMNVDMPDILVQISGQWPHNTNDTDGNSHYDTYHQA